MLLAALGTMLAGTGPRRTHAAPARSVTDRVDGPILHVGPQRAIRTLAEAARQVTHGSTVEIDPGDYFADVAVWSKNGLVLRGSGTGARLHAAGNAAEKKAIWVIRGDDILVDNIGFSGAQVGDRNGAGIRLERGTLSVRDCLFDDNEMGILTANDPKIELTVEGCEFARNGEERGLSHGLYAGTIARLLVRASYFHHGRVGHLIKSRARISTIAYNRLTDEPGGRASYELDFPNGGSVTLIGNLIEQGASTENIHVIAFGAEGYRWPRNSLHLIHNTIADKTPQRGRFLRILPGLDEFAALRNLYLGPGILEYPAGARHFGDATGTWHDVADAGNQDYQLRARSPLVATGPVPLPEAFSDLDLPTFEYQHPCRLRQLAGSPQLVGALQSLSFE